MANYICTKHGNEAAQEWTSRKKIAPSKPAYSQVILDRHVARVKATRERIELKLKSLRVEKMAAKTETISAPTNCRLLKELCKVDDQIAKGDIQFNNEVKLKLTNDEKMVHSNV